MGEQSPFYLLLTVYRIWCILFVGGEKTWKKNFIQFQKLHKF